jgi:hypothetical protein
MNSHGEAEENFIRKLFGENIRRRDNIRNVTVNGGSVWLELMWARAGSLVWGLARNIMEVTSTKEIKI